MKYFITDGKNYISQPPHTGYVLTTKKEEASTWDEEKAKRVLLNLPKRIIRENFKLLAVDDQQKSTLPTSTTVKKDRYCVSDGTFFVAQTHDGKFFLTKKQEEAIKWKQEQADNFVKRFPKKLSNNREKFTSVKVEGGITSIQIEGTISKPKIDTSEVKVDKIELNFNIDSFIEDMATKAQLLQKRHDFLATELSRLDKERVDIEHFIEFNKLSASKGYKAYLMLHNNAVERREVKNEIAKINAIFSQKVTIDGTNTLKQTIKSLENRTYSPRVLDDLF